jgi:MinD superfamily P-loop ATPase
MNVGLKRPQAAERLDCGVFSADLEMRENHRFSPGCHLCESAAQAGALQTLREFTGDFQFENTPWRFKIVFGLNGKAFRS